MKIKRSELKSLIEEVLEEGLDGAAEREYKNSMKNIKRKVKQIEMALKQRDTKSHKNGHYDQQLQLADIEAALNNALVNIKKPIDLD